MARGPKPDSIVFDDMVDVPNEDQLDAWAFIVGLRLEKVALIADAPYLTTRNLRRREQEIVARAGQKPEPITIWADTE